MLRLPGAGVLRDKDPLLRPDFLSRRGGPQRGCHFGLPCRCGVVYRRLVDGQTRTML